MEDEEKSFYEKHWWIPSLVSGFALVVSLSILIIRLL